MGIFDMFKKEKRRQTLTELDAAVSEKKKEVELLDKDVADKQFAINEIITNRDSLLLDMKIEAKKEIEDEIAALKKQHAKVLLDIDTAKKEVIMLEDEALFQSFGLYKPQYEFANADEYRSKLEKVRARQKDMIKNGTAATGNTNWTVSGSEAKGKKMIADMQKLLLRAFNGECEEITTRVKYSNFDQSLKRITTSFDAVSKLGKVMGVAITRPYYDSKIDELRLAFEYQQKKQQEKEEQKELKAQMREEAKLQKEIEKQREKIEKEQSHYQNALSKLLLQMEGATGEKLDELLAKKTEIESNLKETEKAMRDVDYRAANQKAGYVYVVSNIGSFGENVYKIGMTRRLDPQDRIDELGSASVPFNFDIHAMIFSEDAPGLEAALTTAFISSRETRREFFRVSLDEIKAVVNANYNKTTEFIDLPEAEQYRVSEKMKNQTIA